MNKKTLIITLAVLVVLAAGYYYRVYKPAIPGTEVAPSGQESAGGTTRTVTLTDSGPKPRVLEIKSGDRVKFVNNGTRPFWVASDPHPTHNLCKGFDSSHGLVHNESWSHTFTFSALKNCTYHNHVDPTTTLYSGVISIVK